MAERAGIRTCVVLRAAPWFLILVLIAIVQLVRDQPFDAALFGAGAVAIAVDALAELPAGPRFPSLPLTIVLVAVAAVAIVLVLAPRHGLVEGIAVGAVGIVAVPLAWLPRPGVAASDAGERRVRVRRAAIGWSLVVVLACLAELWSFLMGRVMPASADPPPAISALLRPGARRLGGPDRVRGGLARPRRTAPQALAARRCMT